MKLLPLLQTGPYISSVDGQTRIDIGTLEQELADVSGEVWYFLGVQLDVPVHVLDDIDSGERSSCTHKKHEMLIYWMEHAKGTPETWKTLLNSLSILGYETLANSIESKYRLHLTDMDNKYVQGGEGFLFKFENDVYLFVHCI